MPTQYSGPKDIVILGGGLAGLAAADALTEALAPLAAAGALPAGLRITIVEGEDRVGGRAASVNVAALDPAEHPHRPSSSSTTHAPAVGLHFVPGWCRHLRALCRDAPSGALSPARPTSTINAWLTPPDLAGDGGGWHGPGRVVALHMCDPADPSIAWDSRTRAILEAFRRQDAWASALEAVVVRALFRDIEIDDWLSFLDILFDEEHLSPQLRWTLFFSSAFAQQLRQVEQSVPLNKLMGGHAPQDVDAAELWAPLWRSIVVERLKETSALLAPFFASESAGATSIAPVDALLAVARTLTLRGADGAVRVAENVLGGVGLLSDEARAGLELLRLVVRDTDKILAAPGWDPKESAFITSIAKAAFTAPHPFDTATLFRSAQLGHRNFASSQLQVFDGDDSQAVWESVRARVLGRGVPVAFKTATWAKHVDVAHDLAVHRDRVRAVDVTTTAASPPRVKRAVPCVDPTAKGAVTERIDADAVITSLTPACLRALLPATSSGAPPGSTTELGELRRRTGLLAPLANETVNLQLFLDARVDLPFADPANSTETRPFSIGALDGPFAVLVDLRRAWSAPAFAALGGVGSAWELVGPWAGAFVRHRGHGGSQAAADAAPARYQWPLGVQQLLARTAQDSDDIAPWSIDARSWEGAARAGAPVFGEVKAAARQSYFERWVEEVGPIVVEQALRQVAAMPGLSASDNARLDALADSVAKREPAPVKWIFTRGAHAETKVFSSQPRAYALRPHARYEAAGVLGLWCCGEWTRNGLNVPGMEAAVVSGLLSASGVIEAMRAGGLSTIRGPRVTPDMMPNDAWDPGP